MGLPDNVTVDAANKTNHTQGTCEYDLNFYYIVMISDCGLVNAIWIGDVYFSSSVMTINKTV